MFPGVDFDLVQARHPALLGGPRGAKPVLGGPGDSLALGRGVGVPLGRRVPANGANQPPGCGPLWAYPGVHTRVVETARLNISPCAGSSGVQHDVDPVWTGRDEEGYEQLARRVCKFMDWVEARPEQR